MRHAFLSTEQLITNSSAERFARQMFKTGVLSMYVSSNGDYYFFLPRCDFFINEKEQNFRTVHIINMCWRNANFSSPLSIICDNHLHIISFKIRIKEFQIALFIQIMRCLKNQPGFYYLLSLYFYLLLF